MQNEKREVDKEKGDIECEAKDRLHVPVLLDETVGFLLHKNNCIYPHTFVEDEGDKFLHQSIDVQSKGAGVYVDATVGSGGHAEKILEASSPNGKLIGLDIDPSVLEIARKKLEKFGDRCSLVELNYTEVASAIKKFGIEKIDGIIFDLGVNLEHFVNSQRGFSFLKDGPLDMRLSPKIKTTAADIVNNWEAGDLVRIIYKFGEEQYAKRIVRNLVEARKTKRISTTVELAELIASSVPRSRTGKIHPATKTFQALRIVVNNELYNLETVLPDAVNILNQGGRICVISFHSLEDKLVKHTFRSLSGGCICPPEVDRCMCGNKPKIKIITKKAVVPSEEEIFVNPRARSAKLRVAEKI